MRMRALLPVISALVIGGAALPAMAEGRFLPERRVVTYDNLDYYGGDLRSLRGVSLDRCVRACQGEEACNAFTYNSRSDACFLKNETERSEVFRGAISGKMEQTGSAQADRASRMAQQLGFLKGRDFSNALEQANTLPLQFALEETDPKTLQAEFIEAQDSGRFFDAEQLAGSLVVLTDSAGSWLRLAALYETWDRRNARGETIVNASVNAALRAENADEEAAALSMLGTALIKVERGRDGLRAYKAAQAISPNGKTARKLQEARERFGFRILDHSVESDNAAPRLCVEFSDPLDPAFDYAPYVKLSDNQLALEVADRTICADGAQHGENYALTLREGLPAAEAGEALLSDVILRLYVRDRSPSVRLGGRAYILPKTKDTAIPVTTINAETVALRLFRVTEKNLLRSIQGNFFGEDLDAYREDRIADRLGDPLWKGTLETKGALNAEAVTAVPVAELIPDLQPGAYALTARLPENEDQDWQDAQTQWFMVSDTGVATTSARDGLHVFARSLSTAAASEGVTLTLLAANNETLGTAETDEKGYARFAPGLIRGTLGNAPRLLLAEGGAGDFAMLDLKEAAFDLSDRGVEGRAPAGPIDIFVTTERGAYRPRETVFATILARDSTAKAVSDLPLTAKVMRPDGVTHLERVLDDEGAGGRMLSFALSEGAMRGSWTLQIHDDPKDTPIGTASFLVEDFVPERIEVALTTEEAFARFGETLPVSVQADYLFGAPGAGLSIEGEVLLSRTRKLTGYDGYLFGLADEESSTQRRALQTNYVTDADGAMIVPMPLGEPLQGTQPMEARAVLRVREGSGRAVQQSLTLPVEGDTIRIGIKPRFDGAVKLGTEAGFDVIAVNGIGERVALDGLSWTLSRLQTRYQWYRSGARWNYEPYTKRIRIASGITTIPQDEAAGISDTVDWGRHELVVRLPGGEQIAASVQFQAGWYAPVAGSGTPDILQVALDKEQYRAGETATLNVEARHAGEALIQVVTDRLIEMKAVSLDKGESAIQLPVTADWGAGAYVIASLITPMNEADKRNPSRALGVAYLPVDPAERLLSPRFTGPEEASPRGTLNASLEIDGLPAGEQAYVTVAAVDVGVLNITEFEPPAPEDWYFGQRRLGVELRDLYGRLIDGLNGVRGRIRSGGGAMPGSVAPPPVEDVLARFSGIVQVNEEGKAQIEFDLPDFNGTVRLMAIAWSETAVGSASKDVLVRDPIVTTLSTPRFLAPGDESRILVELTHVFGPTGRVAVEADASAGLALLSSDEPIGGMIEEGGKLIFEIPIRADMIGDMALSFVTTIPGGERLTKSLTLPVRSNEPSILTRKRFDLSPDGKPMIIGPDMFEDFVSGSASATVTVGALAALDAADMLSGLDLYPYGCTEQTASRALPLLYYGEVAQQLGLSGPGHDVRGRIEQAIKSILARQGGSGGFGLWRSGSGDTWLDAYVTDFLSRAQAQGYDVPDYAFDNALDNLRNRIGYVRDIPKEGAGLAYGLMVLAREGEAIIGDLRYYADQKADAFPTSLSLAQLGAALALYGEQQRADAMFALASDRVLSADGKRRGWRDDYGSFLRDASGVLALAAEAGSTAIDRKAILGRISDAANEQRYTSTQEKVWTLLAANALQEEAQEAGITLNGQAMDSSVFRLSDWNSASQLVLASQSAAVPVTVSVRGKPATPQPARSNGYTIRRNYLTLDGEQADLSQVKQNDRLIVELVVRNQKERRGRLMIDDPLPAGFEIDNPNLMRSAELDWLEGETSNAEYTAFQTDRFLAAVTGRERQMRFVYSVRAVSPGEFLYPAAQVEDMYRPEFRARTASGSLTVLPQ